MRKKSDSKDFTFAIKRVWGSLTHAKSGFHGRRNKSTISAPLDRGLHDFHDGPQRCPSASTVSPQPREFEVQPNASHLGVTESNRLTTWHSALVIGR